MKYLLVFLTVWITVTSNAFAQSLPNKGSSVTITYPIEGSVLQRKSDNKANFTITAQAGTGYEEYYDFYYKIIKINPFDGKTSLGIVKSGQFSFYPDPMPSNLDVKMLNAQISDLEGGWYVLKLEIWLAGNGPFLQNARRLNIPEYAGSRSIKFGVGDVYVIAGQSNAQGFQTVFDTKLLTYDPTLIDDELPDACRVLSYFQGELGENGGELISFPHLNQFQKLVKTKPSGFHDHPIYPIGSASWCWAPLGKYYVASQGVPIQFYNVAVANSSINEWQNNTNNYKRLVAVLKRYANIQGIRGILWHQGERDAQNNMSYNDYLSKVNALIQNSKNAFDTNLTWNVSQASYYSFSNTGSDCVIDQPCNANTNSNIIQAQNDASNKRVGISTDDLLADKRGPEKRIHIHSTAHSIAGERWNNRNLWEGIPIKGQEVIPQISIQKTGSGYVLTPPAGHQKYFWVVNERGLESTTALTEANRTFIAPLNTSTRTYYTCYFTDDTGNIGDETNGFDARIQICQPFISPNLQDGNKALNVSTSQINYNRFQDSKIIDVSALNLSWISNISYNSGSGWLSIDTPYGGTGDVPVAINTTQNNTSANARSATVTFEENNGGTNYIQNITITQEGSQSGCQNYISDMNYAQNPSQSCCGSPKRDFSIDGNALTIGGNTYAKGIGTHANSNIKFNLNGEYANFQTYIGLDDEIDFCFCGSQTVIFKVYADGQLLYTSPYIHTYTSPIFVDIPVLGKLQLELVVEDVSNSTEGEHVNWADAKLLCNGDNPCPPSLTFINPIDNYPITPTPAVKKAINTISADNQIIGNNTTVRYQAGKAIILQPGFKVDSGTYFKADIRGCN